MRKIYLIVALLFSFPAISSEHANDSCDENCHHRKSSESLVDQLSEDNISIITKEIEFIQSLIHELDTNEEAKNLDSFTQGIIASSNAWHKKHIAELKEYLATVQGKIGLKESEIEGRIIEIGQKY